MCHAQDQTVPDATSATPFPGASTSTLPAPGSIAAQAARGGAQAGKKKRFLPLIGPDVEYTYLLSSKTRSRFGSTIFSIGPGIGDPAPTLKGELGPDFSITSASQNQNGFKNKLFLVSLGPEYKQVYIPPAIRRKIKEAQRQGAIAQAQAQAGGQTGPPPGFPTGPPAGFGGPPPFLPYYGASLNALYADVKVPGENIKGSGFGAGGSVFVGIAIKSRAFFEVRARETTSVKGFNFGSVGLQAGLRF